jgi:hypothetical protein
MEPLVASKLTGDYRAGKRINMKRVIGYIASGYRKDKIWLRRTKPVKRDYRVVVAVDDSQSMLKSGAGEIALKAMATLACGVSQLEIGELCIASFGNEIRILQTFDQPFTDSRAAWIAKRNRIGANLSPCLTPDFHENVYTMTLISVSGSPFSFSFRRALTRSTDRTKASWSDSEWWFFKTAMLSAHSQSGHCCHPLACTGPIPRTRASCGCDLPTKPLVLVFLDAKCPATQ